MKEGLDSSLSRPNPAQAAAAYAAGIRIWGGYFGLRPRNELGLQTLWSRADFEVVQNAGMTAIGFCSGWDDPVALRARAAEWGILGCPDVERFIRDDGPWVGEWLALSGFGLYGLASVHYEVGRPIGRGAAFNIVANYPTAGCSGETWPSWLPRPAGPCAWQCQGDHQEFGLEVDRGSYDDWFFKGDDMSAQAEQQIADIWAMLVQDANIAAGTGEQGALKIRLQQIADAIAKPAPVDVPALVAALTPVLTPALVTALVAALPATDAKAVIDELSRRLRLVP